MTKNSMTPEEIVFAAKDSAGLSREEMNASVEKFKSDFVREILGIQGKELEEIVNRPAKPAVGKFKRFWHKVLNILTNDTEDK